MCERLIEELESQIISKTEGSDEGGYSDEYIPTSNEQIREFQERAKELYIEILSFDPSRYQAVLNLGVIEAKMEDFKSSLTFLNKAKQLHQTDYRIYLNMGNVKFKDSDYKIAIELYKESLKFKKGNLKVYKPYLIALSKLEQWTELEKVSKEVLKIDKKNPLALALLCRALKENESYDELESILTKMNKKLEGKEKSGRDFARQEVSKTIFKLKKKIKTKIKDINKNKVFNKQFEMKKSQQLATEVEVIYSNDILNTDYIDKDPREFLTILKTDKNNKEALITLAMIYYNREENLLAEEYFSKLHQIDPNYKGQILNEKLGDIHYRFHKNVEEALKFYHISNSITENHLMLVKIGRCYEKLNDLNQAYSYYENSLKKNPNFFWSIFHLGVLNSKLGRHNDALSFLKKAYEMDKDSTLAIAKYSEQLTKSVVPEEAELGIEILQKAKMNYLGNVEILCGLARAYENRGRIKEAIAILEEANSYTEFYSSPNRLFLLAFFYEKDMNLNKAIQIYKSILALNKKHLQSLVHLGFILHNSREYKRAHKYFKFALKIDPSLAPAHYGMGRIFQTMKNYQDSLHHFGQSVVNDKTNFKAYFQMGIIHLDMNNYEKARENFEKCLQLNNEFILGIVGLGNVYYELGDYSQAEKHHYTAVQISDGNNIQVFVSYANTLMALQKYDEAIQFYHEAIRIDPDISDIYYFLGNAFFLSGRHEDAIPVYVRSIKIEKNRRPEAYFNLGNVLCTMFRYKEAVKCFKMTLKLDPSNFEAYFNLANCYHILGSNKKACINYEECLKRNYMVKDVKLSLARTYFQVASTEGFGKCEDLLKSLLNEDPKNNEVMMYLALIKEKTNKTGEAINLYKKILEINPQHKEAKENLSFLGVLI